MQQLCSSPSKEASNWAVEIRMADHGVILVLIPHHPYCWQTAKLTCIVRLYFIDNVTVLYACLCEYAVQLDQHVLNSVYQITCRGDLSTICKPNLRSGTENCNGVGERWTTGWMPQGSLGDWTSTVKQHCCNSLLCSLFQLDRAAPCHYHAVEDGFRITIPQSKSFTFWILDFGFKFRFLEITHAVF